MIRIAGDSSFQIAFPLDSDISSLVERPARRFLRLCRLSPPISRFLIGRLTRALHRCGVRERGHAGRARLTLSSRAGTLRMTFRVTPAAGVDLRRLAPLTRGAPPRVRVDYRKNGRSGVLSIRAPLPSPPP